MDAISRILEEVPFYIVRMKEPDYIMQIMTTYGTMKQLGDQKLRHVMVNGSRQVHSF